MARTRQPDNNWGQGNPSPAPTNPKPSPKPAPKAAKEDLSKVLATLEDQLNSVSAENKRLSEESAKLREAHEQELKAKQDALTAAEDKILRIEKELSEAKADGAKTGDNTYDELIAMRESTELECKRLQAEVTRLNAELTQEKEARAKLGETLAEKMQRIEALEKESSAQAKQLADLTQTKTKAEEDLAAALASLSAGTGNTLEVDSLKQQVSELEQKRAETASKVVDLQKELDDMKAFYSGKTAVETGQYQAIQKLLSELKGLDPAKRGIDAQVVQRIAQKIDELEAAKASAEANLARAGSGDHSACSAEIARLNARCVELEKIKDKALQDLQTAVNDLNTANQRADSEKDQADELRVELYVANEAGEKTREFLDEMDPEENGSAEGQEKRIRELVAKGKTAGKPTPRQGTSATIVALVAVLMLVVGALGSFLFMKQRAAQVDTTAMTAASASASASSSASASVGSQSTVGSELPETPEPKAEVPTGDKKLAIPPDETCYPVDANVIALFFGQELRDGKVYGEVPVYNPGFKRIKCASNPVYDEASKQTDISGCEVCLPVAPGTYKLSDDLMLYLFDQGSAGCYKEPRDHFFHKWPAGKSIRFECQSPPLFDAVANCRDLSGCSVVVPDPNVVKCDTCSQ